MKKEKKEDEIKTPHLKKPQSLDIFGASIFLLIASGALHMTEVSSSINIAIKIILLILGILGIIAFVIDNIESFLELFKN